MTRYLLDTNVISNVTKANPSERLVEWMAAQDDLDLFIAALTVAEVRRGILEAPAGRKRNDLMKWFEGTDGPQQLFAGRILAFDEPASILWANLMAAGRRTGRPRNELDMIIAATAGANGCVIVTDNERDFWGLEAINPMRDGSVS